MDLIERDNFLTLLQSQLKYIEAGEGHCLFVSGEAGIGKTALVKTFCKEQKGNCTIYQGACDALFTPRPLSPLYDIMWQVKSDLWPCSNTIEERSALFTRFFRALNDQKQNTLIVFEDIHWADEATIDFIKFFARRISLLPCLFILTYRDDEINSGHPLRNLLGQLPPDSFTSLQLTPLSRGAVKKMADEKGYSGEDVYNISGGNPFYVNEILASYSLGVPDNIKNAILSTYNSAEQKTREIWDLLSVIPGRFEIKYLEKLQPLYAAAIENSVEKKILIISEGKIYFKHELYRRTIEMSLTFQKRISLNKNILDMFQVSFEKNKEIERIIHHAKNANAFDVVVHYAPLAAKQAASVGAHIEASKLYLTAIENYFDEDENVLLEFYEGYAYECYLTNQIREAIIYAGKSLTISQQNYHNDKIGNSLRFLSRLWWFDGNRKKAEYYAEQAIAALNHQSSSTSKAMAFSNMSQLKMLSDQSAECISWGEKAIAIAKELGDEETLCHALNTMGSAMMLIKSSALKGTQLLYQSLQIALQNSYHEHVARAYTALGTNGVTMKDYAVAEKTLNEGIHYCEEKDLDSLRFYMLSWKARLYLETGNWNEANSIAEYLLKNEEHVSVVKIGTLIVAGSIRLRKGDPEALPLLLKAKAMAFEIMELQRIIPALSALLEYEWITGNSCIEAKVLDEVIEMMGKIEKITKKNKLYYWLRKARKEYLPLKERYEGYEPGNLTEATNESSEWEKLGCPYEQALALFEGNDDDKRRGLTIIHGLGANAVYEKMKFEMRNSGIKNIPRGIRKTTQSNTAFLTCRELDVLPLLKEGLQNKEIAAQLFISPKTVDHHISSILFKLDVNSRNKAVTKAMRLEIIA